jgi:hypothetical protein
MRSGPRGQQLPGASRLDVSDGTCQLSHDQATVQLADQSQRLVARTRLSLSAGGVQYRNDRAPLAEVRAQYLEMEVVRRLPVVADALMQRHGGR